MSTWSPLAVAEPWNLVAEGYAEEASAVMEPFSRAAVELAKPARTARVVDVAAGPGTLALQLAPRVASITAVDFSEAMNERLRVAARARGYENIEVFQADGQALPLADAAYDAGFSMFGWMFFPDRPRGLAELRRVLRPGASLVVSSWAPYTRAPLMAAMFGALSAADENFKFPVSDPESLEHPERLAHELREGGFEQVAVHERTVALSFENVEALWARMVRSSAPLFSLRKRLGEDVWSQRSTRALAYLRSKLGETPEPLATTAWLGFGIRPQD
jgi:ubiquinone/menaquinone biosynthesis C-methylase UbiE